MRGGSQIPSTGNVVISREGVAIPNRYINFSQTFDEGEDKLLLEGRVFASIYSAIKESIGRQTIDRLIQNCIMRNSMFA